jgi:mRNA interferase YafQ
MYKIGYSGIFKKDLKTPRKRSLQNSESLRSFIKELQITGYKGIDQQYKPHKLLGKYSSHCECHILNDLLIIWFQYDSEKTIILVRTGTLSDLFR